MEAISSLEIFILLLLLSAAIAFVYSCYAAHQVDWGHGWINFLDGFLRLYIRYYHRFQYEPVPIPEQGPALLVANHVSGLDPLLMIAACKRPVRFLIAEEQYHRFGLHWVFKQVGCIPVQRGGRVDKAFRAALKALEAGEVVGLFPEGQIHPSRKSARRLKGGVVKLSQLSGVAVYPMHIDGLLFEGLNVLALLMPNKARLQSFPPIACHELDHDKCMSELTTVINKSRVQDKPKA